VSRGGAPAAPPGCASRSRASEPRFIIFKWETLLTGPPAMKTVGRWSALYCRGAPVGAKAPCGRALGAHVVWTASPSSLGRSTGPEPPVSGAMASLVVPRLPALRSGRRQRACAARRSTAGCYPPFQQHLLPRFSRYDRLRGPAPTASLRQRCLRLRHARRLAARGGPA